MTSKEVNPLIDRGVRIFIPLLISGLAVWLVLRNIDFESLTLAFKSISLGLLFWCVVTFLIGLLLRVWSWHLILKRQFPFRRVFFVMNAGYLLNNVLPFRMGELGRAFLLGTGQNGSPGKLEVLSSVFVERIYDIFLACVFFLSCLPWVVNGGSAAVLAFIMLVLVLLAFLLVVIASKRQVSILDWMDRRKDNKWLIWIKPKLISLLNGFSVLTNGRLFLASFSIMAFSWVLSMVQQTPLRMTLMPNGEWWCVIFVVASGAFGGALPSAPASLGVYEAAVVGAFSLLNVDQSKALAYALIVHAIQFSFSSIFGLIGLLLEGKSITEIYRNVKRAKVQETIP